jgi:fido (protein-threonine AMPylation protein)
MRSIPADLAHAQQEWQATYRQLAAAPRTALRRRLIHLSSQVLFHPYWQGNGTTARAALFAPGRGGGR